jgi:hypothetical protein
MTGCKRLKQDEALSQAQERRLKEEKERKEYYKHYLGKALIIGVFCVSAPLHACPHQVFVPHVLPIIDTTSRRDYHHSIDKRVNGIGNTPREPI